MTHYNARDKMIIRMLRTDADEEDIDWITTSTGLHVPLKGGKAVGGPLKGEDFSDAESVPSGYVSHSYPKKKTDKFSGKMRRGMYTPSDSILTSNKRAREMINEIRENIMNANGDHSNRWKQEFNASLSGKNDKQKLKELIERLKRTSDEDWDKNCFGSMNRDELEAYRKGETSFIVEGTSIRPSVYPAKLPKDSTAQTQEIATRLDDFRYYKLGKGSPSIGGRYKQKGHWCDWNNAERIAELEDNGYTIEDIAEGINVSVNDILNNCNEAHYKDKFGNREHYRR